MSEHNYRDFWQEAVRQIREEYKAKGKDSDFQFWFNMEYVEDNYNTITVSVPSTFMWNQMQSKGYVKAVADKICSLTGQKNIEITSIVKSQDLGEIIHSSKKEEAPIQVDNNYLKNTDRDYPNAIPIFTALKENFKEQTSTYEEYSEKRQENTHTEVFNKPIQTSVPQVKSELFVKHPQLREDYTFENFIPGDNSNLAYNVCLDAAKNPGRKWNPILIYGGVGLGKTHLMQSIGNYIYKEKGSSTKICCVAAEKFTNEFIASLHDQTASKFKNKYRKLDVLLIDDIHFLQDKEGTQEELFHTFNALFDNHSQLVFTCDRPISELKNITERLKSRFSLGMNVDIQMPNYETRRAILIQKLAKADSDPKFLANLQAGVVPSDLIPDDVIDYIAKNVQTNVRDLEASLTKMIGYACLIHEKITVEIAQQQLRDVFSSPLSGTITIDIIQKVVAEHYNISLSDIKGKKRDRKYVIPRQIALYIARQLTEYSLKELGNEFGGRDHSTAMHSLEKVEDALKIDSQLDSVIQLLIRNIKDYKK